MEMIRCFSAKPIRPIVLLVTILLTASATLQAENWPRYRGPNGTGLSNLKGLPTTWRSNDYAWDRKLPGVGHSSPIIWEDQLFITSAIEEGAVRYLFCLNAQTGKQIWVYSIGMNRSHKHRKGSWASSTPVTDGKTLVVLFADEEKYLINALDLEGNLLWRRNLGSFHSQHGQGVSPVIHGDKVIVANDQRGPSSVVAYDLKTGRTVWSYVRDQFRNTSYATPFVYTDTAGKSQLILGSGAMGITSLDLETGRLNWTTGILPARTVASPVAGEGMIFQTCGGGGVGRLLIGVDPGGQGNVSESHIKYRRDRILPYVPTPIVFQGHLYLWNDNGVVSCVNIASGENLWTNRLGGNYSGSPICVDGKLYCIDEAGEVVVVAASPKYKKYGKTSLGDPSHATPAVAGGNMYLRTYHRLFCLPAKPTGTKTVEVVK